MSRAAKVSPSISSMTRKSVSPRGRRRERADVRWLADEMVGLRSRTSRGFRVEDKCRGALTATSRPSRVSLARQPCPLPAPARDDLVRAEAVSLGQSQAGVPYLMTRYRTSRAKSD
jgi:hypothetical protein